MKFLPTTLTSGLALIMLATAFGCGRSLKEGSPLPNLSMQLIGSGKRFDTRTIKSGQAIAVLYFSPSCNHCRQETRDLIAHIGQLQQICFLLITAEPYEDLDYFYKEFQLAGISNFVVGRDDQLNFYHYLQPKQIPFLAIYNSERKLDKICVGIAPINQIIKFTQDAAHS